VQKKWMLIFTACLTLLIAFLFTTVTTATDSDQATTVMFKTPEDAVTTYLEGVAQGDFRKIMQACAIDEMGENFKFDLYIDRLQAFQPFQSQAPANYPLFVELNKAQISAQISSQVKILYYSLLSTEDVSSGKTIVKLDAERVNTFIKAVDPKKLSKLEVKKIAPPNKTLMNTARYIDNAAKIARVQGADESTERVALFSFEQNYYFLGFSLLRYGDNWKISSQASALANTSVLGAPVKTTPEKFESMLNGS